VHRRIVAAVTVSPIRTRPRVVLTDPIVPSAQAELDEFADAMVCGVADLGALRMALRSAQALIIRSFLPDDIFEDAPTLLAAVRHGAGPDMLPLGRASELGIAVATVPGVNGNAVAELAVGQMLQLARGAAVQERRLRERGWAAARELALQQSELGGRTVGIIGLGSIGRRLAEICRFGLRMRVLGFRRGDSAPPPIELRPLDALIAESDFVVLACPLTPETRGLLSAERIALMKPTACVVNVARGPVLDQDALIAALHSGRIAGAALDVFEPEPLPSDSPVLAAPNLLATPHMAGITREAAGKIAHGAVSAVRRILAGERPDSLVNPQAWPAVLERRGSWLADA
jgi:D-3-phosphoglycerate dehydrogenase / 2-oxoglutarate reductase